MLDHERFSCFCFFFVSLKFIYTEKNCQYIHKFHTKKSFRSKSFTFSCYKTWASEDFTTNRNTENSIAIPVHFTRTTKIEIKEICFEFWKIYANRRIFRQYATKFLLGRFGWFTACEKSAKCMLHVSDVFSCFCGILVCSVLRFCSFECCWDYVCFLSIFFKLFFSM